MIYADEQQIGVHQEICGGHHQICADVTMGFVGVRKLVHLDKFLQHTQERVQLLCSQTALQSKGEILSPHPDIDEIRWQNSTGADSRLIGSSSRSQCEQGTSRLPYSTDSYFHPLVFVFVSRLHQ